MFNWSASGQIIAETLSSLLPCSVLFVMDSILCRNPNTFMSNMLFCCSVMFRLRLPIVVLFNKSDLEQDRVQEKWIKDYDEIVKAL